jgi:predicted transcriptional regulator
MGDILTKKAFAEMTGVSAACVSQWISRKKISGDALVGRGCRARIRVEVAREQLKRNLDIDQRTSLGMSAKAKLDARKPAASAQEAASGAVP